MLMDRGFWKPTIKSLYWDNLVISCNNLCWGAKDFKLLGVKYKVLLFCYYDRTSCWTKERNKKRAMLYFASIRQRNTTLLARLMCEEYFYFATSKITLNINCVRFELGSAFVIKTNPRLTGSNWVSNWKST